jgi:K(+)-stimulated pyrophosphate-energized sodium pump
VVKYSHNVGLRTGVALVAVAIVVAAVVISKRRSSGLDASDPGSGAAAVAAAGQQAVSAPQPAAEGTNGTAPATQPQQTTP